MHWYVEGIVELLLTTLRARQVFGEVVHMVKPPSSLFHPLLLVKVLTHRRPRR
jgi:hypothetical protein